MIDQNIPLPDMQDLPAMRAILDSIQKAAIEFIYTSTVPTTIPTGKIVIYDNGAGTKRLYLKTGKGNIGFVNLT